MWEKYDSLILKQKYLLLFFKKVNTSLLYIIFNDLNFQFISHKLSTAEKNVKSRDNEPLFYYLFVYLNSIYYFHKFSVGLRNLCKLQNNPNSSYTISYHNNLNTRDFKIILANDMAPVQLVIIIITLTY